MQKVKNSQNTHEEKGGGTCVVDILTYEKIIVIKATMC